MSAGFYLGFIVWGRSPYWPKATSFLGGSFPHLPMESVRFYVEDDENEIFSTLSSARARTNVILVGKCESHRHSTTNFSENVVVAKTRCYEIYHLAIGRGLHLLQRR